MAVLEVRNLTVDIPTEDGTVHAVRDVSFSVKAGSLFGIAGESGSGKSVLTQAIMGLLPNARITGEVLFEGRNLVTLTKSEMRAIRGGRIGMIFQDPLSCLHPYYTVGSQIAEVIEAHESTSRQTAKARAIDMLRKVGIPSPQERYDSFPHQFSGGMRQRVMIAMALVLKPALIIADEPTTALDVSVQAQIVSLLDAMRRDFGTSVILITHDLGLLGKVSEDLMVMYAGSRMEYGPSRAVLSSPANPYTSGLLRSAPANYQPGAELVPITGKPPSLLTASPGCVFAPRCEHSMPRCTLEKPPLRIFSDNVESRCWLASEPTAPRPGKHLKINASDLRVAQTVVEVQDLHLTYRPTGMFGARSPVDVLKGINLTVSKGEIVGLVGESGCGKSSLARVIAGLNRPSKGSIKLLGQDLNTMDSQTWKSMRRQVQMVFQDPFGSLNPRRRVGSIIGDPFRLHAVCYGDRRKRRVKELMEMVGLNPEHYNRFPSEFSGGQRQRIGIARAVALNPALIICDEPVSALDVSIQAQVLNLLRQLQRDLGLTYLFISHDLSVVRHICDRIAVMKDGAIVEMAPSEEVFARPGDPYTRLLLAASNALPPANANVHRALLETRYDAA